MRHLITGGAGFIGSYLAEKLLERGDEVHILDDLSTGSIENIQHLREHSQLAYTIDSVMNEPLLAELIDGLPLNKHWLNIATQTRRFVGAAGWRMTTTIMTRKQRCAYS